MKRFPVNPSQGATKALSLARVAVKRIYETYTRVKLRRFQLELGPNWSKVEPHLILTGGGEQGRLGPLILDGVVCMWCGQKFAYKCLCSDCTIIPEALLAMDTLRGEKASQAKSNWDEERKSLHRERCKKAISLQSAEQKRKLAEGRRERAVAQWAARTPKEKASIGRKSAATLALKPALFQERKFRAMQPIKTTREVHRIGGQRILLQGSYEPLVAEWLFSRGYKVQGVDFRRYLAPESIKRFGKMSIPYLDQESGVRCRYYPDFIACDDEVHLVEVKSTHTLFHERYFEKNAAKFARAVEFSRAAGFGDFLLELVVNPKKTPIEIRNPTRADLLKLLQRFPRAYAH